MKKNMVAAFLWHPSSHYLAYMLMDRGFLEVIDDGRINFKDGDKKEEQVVRSRVQGVFKFLENKINTMASPDNNGVEVKFELKYPRPNDPTPVMRSSESLFAKWMDEEVNKGIESVFGMKGVSKYSDQKPKFLKSFLKGDHLKQWKNALLQCGILEKKRGQNKSGHVAHLWTLALHVTPKTLDKKIKEIRGGGWWYLGGTPELAIFAANPSQICVW